MSDMNRIFSWGEELLERLYFNSVSWSYHIEEMEGEDPITSLGLLIYLSTKWLKEQKYLSTGMILFM